jgi:hypothetical protein
MVSRARTASGSISKAGVLAKRWGARHASLAAVLACCVVGGLGCSAGPGAQAAARGSAGATLVLKPAKGASTLTPTWSVTSACPGRFEKSAVLYELNTDGSIGSIISPVTPNVTAPFSGTLLTQVRKLFSLGTNVTPGGTSKWEVSCAAGVGGTGAQKVLASTYVTLSANGLSFTTSGTPPTGSLAP